MYIFTSTIVSELSLLKLCIYASAHGRNKAVYQIYPSSIWYNVLLVMQGFKRSMARTTHAVKQLATLIVTDIK